MDDLRAEALRAGAGRGWITLTGEVERQFQRLAEVKADIEVVWSARGVYDVIDRLTMAPA